MPSSAAPWTPTRQRATKGELRWLTHRGRLRFPYLWARRAARGETEGRKFWPVAVGVRIPKPEGEDVLVLFPITSHEPAPERFAAEIPDTEKRRAGLDGALRLWLILDEHNQDVIGRSVYPEPEPPLR